MRHYSSSKRKTSKKILHFIWKMRILEFIFFWLNAVISLQSVTR